jgi:hypothetical protein
VREVGGDPGSARPAGTTAIGPERTAPPAELPATSGGGGGALPPAQAVEIRLRIDSSPRGATVTLEGRRLGRTPIDTQVPSADRPGELELQLRGYRTARRSIARDRDGEVRVSLQREVRRTPRSRPDSSSRSGDRGDGSDRSIDAPDIKERR